MQRTILIAQALQARQETLRVHNMPQEAIPTFEMMIEIENSLVRQFGAEHIFQRPDETRQRHYHRIRNAFKAHVFQAMTADHNYVPFDRQAFWESIRTNNISEEDRERVTIYENERRAAQRHRNVVIASEIIKLGVCVAKAWARNYASTRRRPESLSSAEQPAGSKKFKDARCDLLCSPRAFRSG